MIYDVLYYKASNLTIADDGGQKDAIIQNNPEKHLVNPRGRG